MTLVPQDTLDWLIASLRDGRTYYRHAVVHTQDAEIRRAFEIGATERSAVLAALKEVGMYSPTETVPDDERSIQQVPHPHRYEDLRRQFDPNQPQLQAEALVPRESATLRLMESVFRSHPALVARSVIKRHYLRMQQAGAIIQRMAERAHAA